MVGEVWNANRAWVPLASRDKAINLINQLGLATEPVDQTNLHSFTRAQPGAFMDLCQNLEVPTEVKFLSSKLLWGQLPAHVIEREILPRPEVVTVCIVRDPIEGFISRTKAMALGRWRDLDTTDYKPTLSAGDFEEWANRRKEFNAFIERNGSNISLTFSYEELLTGGSIDHRKLLDLLEGTNLFPPLKLVPGQIVRQDREPEVSKRVANWDEFHRRLIERNLRIHHETTPVKPDQSAGD